METTFFRWFGGQSHVGCHMAKQSLTGGSHWTNVVAMHVAEAEAGNGEVGRCDKP